VVKRVIRQNAGVLGWLSSAPMDWGCCLARTDGLKLSQGKDKASSVGASSPRRWPLSMLHVRQGRPSASATTPRASVVGTDARLRWPCTALSDHRSVPDWRPRLAGDHVQAVRGGGGHSARCCPWSSRDTYLEVGNMVPLPVLRHVSVRPSVRLIRLTMERTVKPYLWVQSEDDRH